MTDIQNERLFDKTNIWGNKKEVTLKDLAQVKGRGMGKAAVAYNQVKLFLTKGIVINNSDIENLVKNPAQLAIINDKFKEVLTAKQEVISDKKAEAKLQKETKHTINAAKAFSKVLGNYDAKSTADSVAIKLEAALFVDQNMKNILKSALYALRSNRDLKELPEGPAKDFINFIKDSNSEINNDDDLKKAVKEFENHIREGKIITPNLEKYPKNSELSNFNKTIAYTQLASLKDDNLERTLNGSFLETLRQLQNKTRQSEVQQKPIQTSPKIINSYAEVMKNTKFKQVEDGFGYSGALVDGKKSGFGTFISYDNVIYQGEFKDNKLEGNAKVFYPDHFPIDYYEREFVDGKGIGQGVFHMKDGSRLEGENVDGKWKSKVKYFPDGSRYEGEFKADMMHGEGIFTDKNGMQVQRKYENDEQIGEDIPIPRSI